MINKVFSTASTGLRAAQLGLDATAHNVANVNTPYFVKENLSLQEQHFLSLPNHAGDGVKAQIVKAGTGLMPQQIQDALALQASGETTLDLANKLADGLNNADIPQKLTNLYNAFADLSANPSSASARQTVLEKAKDLSQAANSVGQLKDGIKTDTQYANKVDTEEFKSLLNQIAQINSSSGADEGSLAAQRSELLGKLNSIASVTSPDNGNTIYLKTSQGQGKELLKGAKVNDITTADLEQAASGKIGARQQFVNSTMPNILTEVGNTLSTVVDHINAGHQAGYDQDAQPGKALFNYNSADPFGSMNTAINNPREVAASTTTTVPGNGNNANNIFNLGSTDGRTMGEALGVAQAKIGGVASKAAQDAKIGGDAYDSLVSQWKSQFGVNLDEEAVNAMRYQRMYEANAKVLQVADSMMGTLLNIVA